MADDDGTMSRHHRDVVAQPGDARGRTAVDVTHEVEGLASRYGDRYRLFALQQGCACGIHTYIVYAIFLNFFEFFVFDGQFRVL